MSEGISGGMDRRLKFFSVGSTLGIVIGLLAGMYSPEYVSYLLLIVYVVLTVVGLWGLRNELKTIIQ
jgi:TctA family transporter